MASLLLDGVQVSIDQCWKLTPPQSEQNPTWAQERREKQTADTTTSQIITQFHKCLLCCSNTCKNSVLYHNDVLSCCTRGGPAQSCPGRLPLQPSGDPSVWLGMLNQVWERNIFMCCIWDLAAKRKVLIICVFTHLKKNGICIHKIIKWCNEVRFFTKWIDVNIWNAQRPSKRKRSIFCC